MKSKETVEMGTLVVTTSIEDLYLKQFKENNPSCKYIIDGENFVIEHPWGADCCRLIFEKDDLATIKELNGMIFPKLFDAIIHIDQNTIEFLFGYISANHAVYGDIFDRQFSFIFSGRRCECSFGPASSRLIGVSKVFSREKDDTGDRILPQIDMIKAALSEDKPKGLSKFIEGKVLKSFFVTINSGFDDLDFSKFARHINFIMNYYDRQSPEIIIREDSISSSGREAKQVRYLEGKFPLVASVSELDDFLLQLIEVGRRSAPRFAFVYYYQVIEYAGFYFIDGKAKKELRHLIRDPALACCDEDKMAQLFSLLTDLNSSDDAKMKRVIEEYCNPKTIWAEIENDKDFFSKPLRFDGGFEVVQLVAPDTTIDSWCSMWMPKLYDSLTKIRNCLVHAREKRQCNVITPTRANNAIVYRYLPIIARVAEQITLNKE